MGVASAAESSAKGEREGLLLKGFKDNRNLVFFQTLESDLITITFSFITLCCRKWHVLHSYLSKDLAALRGDVLVCSSERCFQLVSCKCRLAGTRLSRSLPELTEQRLNLQLNLLLVMLWDCLIVPLTSVTEMGNQRDCVSVWRLGGCCVVFGFLGFFSSSA